MIYIFQLLSLLPLFLLHFIGIIAGEFVYFFSPVYRKRLKENLTHAGYRYHLFAAIHESGKSILELPFVWCATPQRVLRATRIEQWELVQSILDSSANTGIIFLTPHLGCFEIIAQVIATRISLTVLYRPARNVILKQFINNVRSRPNLFFAPANLAGVRILLKALKNNKAIGLLPDQVPQNGEGVLVNFFGKPAYTMTLSIKLQKISGAPIILSYAERLSWGRGFVIHFLKFEEQLGETLEEQVRAINIAMEKLISYCPTQYIWSYNRYKIPSKYCIK